MTRIHRRVRELWLPVLLALFGIQSLDMTHGILLQSGRFSPALIFALSITGWAALALALIGLPFSNRFRFGSLGLFILVAMVLPTLTLIVFRWRTGIPVDVHDGLFQTEIVTGGLLQGHDPYGTDFTRTELVRWFHYTPDGAAIAHHYTYYPAVVLAFMPVYLLERALGLIVDLRPMLLATAAVAFVLILKLPFTWRARYMLSVLLFTNPFFWWVEGRNDILWLTPLLACVLFCLHGRWPAASWALGLSAALKLFAWPFAVLMAAALWFRWRRGLLSRPALLAGLAGLAVPLAITVTPFLLWNAGALWRDTAGWLLENPPGFPINGFGLGQALLITHLVSSPLAPFPFGALQATLSLPLLALGLLRLARDPGLPNVLGPGAAVLTVVLLFGRFTNDNYVVAAVFLLVLAIFAKRQEIRAESDVLPEAA